jgi:anti-anti-sigma regulatory factor
MNMKENEIKVVNTKNGIQLEMSGEFTLRCSEQTKKDLLSSLSREDSESLDLTQTSAMDVAGIQLAYAWKKALVYSGRKATIVHPTSENIKDLFTKTGITQIL